MITLPSFEHAELPSIASFELLACRHHANKSQRTVRTTSGVSALGSHLAVAHSQEKQTTGTRRQLARANKL